MDMIINKFQSHLTIVKLKQKFPIKVRFALKSSTE